MKLRDQIFENYLQHACRIQNPAILNAVKQVLSDKEQDSIQSHASLVTQDKLVLVVKRPERLREIIFVVKGEPDSVKIYRCRLTLKRKQNPGKI